MFEFLRDLAILTIRQPAEAVRQIQSLNLPMGARWTALGATVALSVLLAGVASALFPADLPQWLGWTVSEPLMMAASQLVAIIVMAGLASAIGQAFGGCGSFADALLIVTWIETVILVLQAAQVATMLLFPLIASLLSVAALALFFYLMVAMIKALHGFESTAKVVIGMVATMLGFVFVLSFVMGMLGIMPPMPQEM